MAKKSEATKKATTKKTAAAKKTTTKKTTTAKKATTAKKTAPKNATKTVTAKPATKKESSKWYNHLVIRGILLLIICYFAGYLVGYLLAGWLR